MANDNDFVKERLGELREPEGFQPNAARARIRMQGMQPRESSGRWKWAAVPAAIALVVAMVLPTAHAVARMDDPAGFSFHRIHYYIAAHWNGLLNLIHHIPLGEAKPAPELAAKVSAPPVRLAGSPRVAPEFRIVEPSGKETLLSSQKGKVVVVQFLYTWCGHCEATAEWLSKMQADLGPQGLQVFGVAFNEEVNTLDLDGNAAAVTRFGSHAAFPVGLSAQVPVLEFLGIRKGAPYGVPQLVVIDRDGVIQAQTSARPAQGEVLQEPVMRELVTKLVAEK